MLLLDKIAVKITHFYLKWALNRCFKAPFLSVRRTNVMNIDAKLKMSAFLRPLTYLTHLMLYLLEEAGFPLYHLAPTSSLWGFPNSFNCCVLSALYFSGNVSCHHFRPNFMLVSHRPPLKCIPIAHHFVDLFSPSYTMWHHH